MSLYDNRVLGLAEDFKEVIITDEVEPGELLPLLLKVAVEGFLAHVQLAEDGFQSLLDAWHVAKTDDFWVAADSICDIPVVLINSHESSLLLWKCTSHEDWLQVHPFSLNDVEFGQIVVDATKFLLNLLNLVSKSCVEARLFQRKDQTLMVADLGHHLLPLFDERCLATI